MIKLPNYSTKFQNEYCEKMWSKIEPHVLSKKTDFKVHFRDAFNGDEVNKQFFKDILISPIPEVNSKYNCVKQYFDFVFFMSLDIKHIFKLSGIRSLKKRRELRLYYLELCGATKEDTLLGAEIKKCLSEKNMKCADLIRNDKNFDMCQKFIAEHYDENFGFLKDIFSYEEKNINKELRFDVIESLGIEVCPYCNRQYISNVKDDSDKWVTADIDHFYPKSCFYLWALSIYNFVPSCKLCNLLFKNKWQVDLLYPYTEEYGSDALFKLQPNEMKDTQNLNSLIGWSDEVEIVLDYNEEIGTINKLKVDARLFKIEKLYSIHRNYAINLRYKKSLLEQMLLNWDEMLIKMQLSKEEAKYLLYGMDIDGIDNKKQPLGKLTKDILDKI